MKRILHLPLLLAALALPTAINAESYSLVIGRFTTNNVAVTGIPNIKFSSLAECEEEGRRFANTTGKGRWSYHCFKGK